MLFLFLCTRTGLNVILLIWRFLPLVMRPLFMCYFFHRVSVVGADVDDSSLGLSKCSGGLNDVKVLKV